MEDKMGWRPIADAPKDGTAVLLWGDYWSDSQGSFDKPLIGQWVGYANRWEAWARVVFGVRPTHWMPLPSPPHTSEGSNG